MRRQKCITRGCGKLSCLESHYCDSWKCIWPHMLKLYVGFPVGLFVFYKLAGILMDGMSAFLKN